MDKFVGMVDFRDVGLCWRTNRTIGINFRTFPSYIPLEAMDIKPVVPYPYLYEREGREATKKIGYGSNAMWFICSRNVFL